MATNTTPAKAAPAPAKPEAKKTQKIAPVPAPATDAAKKKTQRIEAVKPATPAPAPSKAKTQKIAPVAPTAPAKPTAPAPYKPTAHKGFVDEGEIFRAVNRWNVAHGIPLVKEYGEDGLPNWTWEFDPKNIPGAVSFSVVETDPKSYNEGDWKSFSLVKGLPFILGCAKCKRTFGGVMCD